MQARNPRLPGGIPAPMPQRQGDSAVMAAFTWLTAAHRQRAPDLSVSWAAGVWGVDSSPDLPDADIPRAALRPAGDQVERLCTQL